MRVIKDRFGVTSGGQAIERFTIDNGVVQLQAISYGAIITTLLAPDRAGQRNDVVLGFDTLLDYERQSPYFGAVVGRYANRIAHARFTLDDVTCHLACNEGDHHLHGGVCGFDKQVWDAHVIDLPNSCGVGFSRRSCGGEEGYPGDLAVQVTYLLNRLNQITIDYHATSDAPTVINLTQHTYFDLSAGAAADVTDHLLSIRASAYTPTDGALIPTGEVAPVSDSPFDFRTPHLIGARIDADHEQLGYGVGYDHNWVLDHSTQTGEPAATLVDPMSGRLLTVHTTEPGLQFYSGNRLDVGRGKGGRRYSPRTGLCLETQHFPDSPSHPHFPSTVLRPGQTFRSRTTWTFAAQ